MSDALDTAKWLGADPEPTKKEIKEAQKGKHCPFCKGQDFHATFELAERNFWADATNSLVWDKRGKDIIETVTCHICGEEIPKEVWEKHWGLEG